MAADEESETLVPVDEEIEGERDGTEDFLFFRVGAPVPLKPSGSAFDLQRPPSQPLAISQRHRVLVVAHSDGFFVAKVEDVIDRAKEIKEKGKGSSVEEASIVDVRIGAVSILSVSVDESTLAAVVGCQILFFSMSSLLNKAQKPSFICSIGEAETIKDFKWQKNIGKSFVVLSSNGKLYHRNPEADLKSVMDKVDAVDWNVEGEFVAVATDQKMTILSSTFKEIFSMPLPFETWPPINSDYTVKVDSIKWLRDDSIIIGCFQINEDGDEEGYLFQVIKSKGHNFTDVSCHPIVYSFPDLIDGVWDILPKGCGPYLLAEYLEYWDVALASTQKAIDEHIRLFKWSMEDNRTEVVSLDFLSEKYTPRIEFPDNGVDNLVLGLCLENFSTREKIMIKGDGEKDKELVPRCTLLFLSSEGKLNLFRVARSSELSDLPLTSVLDPSNAVEGKHSTLSSHDSSTTNAALKDNIENATPDNQSIQMSKDASNTPKGTFQLEKETKSTQRKQTGDELNVGLFGGQIGNSKSSTGSPSTQGVGFGIRNEIGPGAKLLSDPSAKRIEATTSPIVETPNLAPVVIHANRKDPLEHREVRTRVFGSSSIDTPSIISHSTGMLFSADIRPSRFSFSQSVISDAHEKNTSTHQLPSSKEPNSAFQSSAFPSGKNTQNIGYISPSPSSRHVELQHAIQGSQLLAQEGYGPGKSHYSRVQPLLKNLRGSSAYQKLDSDPEISKQFYNVIDMAQELDALLSFIEKEGGFFDACTVRHRSSLLAMENVLGDLSEITHKYKREIEEQLKDIQQLQNKMLQVSARQGYMKGIVEQASNREYWDVWNQRKLNPELEAKRMNILNMNQKLASQIIELERHFNTVEINRFGESGENSLGHTSSRRASVPARQTQSLQSVYNTLNSQLAAAEHLAECLSKQMSELNLNSAATKHQGIKKELFESIGLPDELISFQSPVCKRCSLAPNSIRGTPPSTANSVKQHYAKSTSVATVLEPETARRSRDSLDRNWAAFEPPKTTVKRGTQTQRFRVTADKAFLKAKENFDSQIEAFAMQQKSNAFCGSSSSGYLMNEGISDKASKLPINTSIIGSKWAKDMGSPPNLGVKSYPEVGVDRSSMVPPSMSPSLSILSNVGNSPKQRFGSPDFSKSGATQSGFLSKPFAAKPGETSMKTSSIFSSTIAPSYTRPVAAAKDQPNKTLDLRSGAPAPTLRFPGTVERLADTSGSVSAVIKENSIPSPFSKPAFASSGLSSNIADKTNKTARSGPTGFSFPLASKSTMSVLTSSSPLSSSEVPENATAAPSFTSASLATISFGKSSLTFVPTVGTNQTASTSTSSPDADNRPTNAPPAAPFVVSSSDTKSKVSNQLASSSSSSSNSGPSSTLFSLSEKSTPTPIISLSPASSLSSVTIQTPPVTSGTVSSAHSDKANSDHQPTKPIISGEGATEPKNEKNLLRSRTDSTPLAAPPFQPEKSSSTTSFNTGTEKDEHVDVSLSRDDEMEEEAPDTTTISLGSLGGFGLGSTPSLGASKPNPFGGSFLSTNSSNPSLTSSPSTGEPFRPASFSLPSAQPVQTTQSANPGGFSSGFGQPAQVGAGQQALGSVLGSFGQSRQLGGGMPSAGFPSPSGFGGGGFSTAANTGGFAAGGGFAGAAAGGGFTSVAPTGGGFAAAAKGGGFAAVASAGGGFAGAASGGGFGGLSSSTGGFPSTAPGGSGFGGAGAGSSFTSGGFSAFGSNQGSGFSGFGGNMATGAGKPPESLLTQMRK